MNRHATARIARALLGPTLLASLASACSVAETLVAPYCEGDSSSALIGAQAVPTSALIPCFGPLPAGWERSTVDISQDGAFVVFDSDRAGQGAARFAFTEACEPGDAVPTPTEYEGTQRFELVREVSPGFRAERFYVFDGGCVTWEFDFDDATPSAMSVELGNALQLVDRDVVNDNIRREFVDEEL